MDQATTNHWQAGRSLQVSWFENTLTTNLRFANLFVHSRFASPGRYNCGKAFMRMLTADSTLPGGEGENLHTCSGPPPCLPRTLKQTEEATLLMGEPEVSVSIAAPDFESCLGPPGASKSHTPLGKKLQGKFHRIVNSVSPDKCLCWSAVIIIIIIIIIIVVVPVALVAQSDALSLSGGENENNHTACPSDWIGNGSKCFYFSEDLRNWLSSQKFCMEQNAHLARFDSMEELDFLKRHRNDSAHWIGLHRKSSKHSWRWTDNTEYNNLVSIRGEGEYAYLIDKKISSGRDQTTRKWICSMPKNYTL